MSATGQPCTAADITPAWVLDVASALRADGQAARPSACGLRIEVQSIHTGEWHALALPTLSGRFADRATRDAVLACIEAEASSGMMAREAAATAKPEPASFFTEAQRDQARRTLDTMSALSR